MLPDFNSISSDNLWILLIAGALGYWIVCKIIDFYKPKDGDES